MAEWLEQASQWHDMYCHDLAVMSSNPGHVELGVRSTSALSRTWSKNILSFFTFRYAGNNTNCQIGLFFKKGQKLRSKPSAVWDPKKEPELHKWLWEMAAIEVKLENTFDKTLGITTKHFEYSPPLKYEFIYPNEEFMLKSYPGYEVVIHSTDKKDHIYTFIVQKKEKIVIEPNMVSPDIWKIKHSEWEKSHKWNQWAKSNSLRHLGNMKQPLFVHNYTTTGYRYADNNKIRLDKI